MFLEAVLSFALFFTTALAILAIFLVLYSIVTPYDDYKLIFQDNNTAAAVSFGGAILGLCIPLYSALISSVSYVDFLMWAGIAALNQLLFAFIAIRIRGKYSLEKQIIEGAVPVGIFMAFISISIGLLNAGSMSY